MYNFLVLVPFRLDDVPLRGLKFLSQSTDSLHQGSKVNASTESLTDEGTNRLSLSDKLLVCLYL